MKHFKDQRQISRNSTDTLLGTVLLPGRPRLAMHPLPGPCIMSIVDVHVAMKACACVGTCRGWAVALQHGTAMCARCAHSVHALCFNHCRTDRWAHNAPCRMCLIGANSGRKRLWAESEEPPMPRCARDAPIARPLYAHSVFQRSGVENGRRHQNPTMRPTMCQLCVKD